MMRSILTAATERSEVASNYLTVESIVIIRRIPKICISIGYKKWPLEKELLGNSIMQFSHTISLYLTKSSLKHQDAIITERGQSYCHRKNPLLLKISAFGNMPVDISNRSLYKKKIQPVQKMMNRTHSITTHSKMIFCILHIKKDCLKQNKAVGQNCLKHATNMCSGMISSMY